MPSLEEDKPDIALIHVGTCNLLKKHFQTAAEICKEIFEVVKECENAGVNEIYVSSITSRPEHQYKINKINLLLSEHSYEEGFKFIDNSNIKPCHLWKDKTHLLKEGSQILKNNFLDYLNRSHMYNSSWD